MTVIDDSIARIQALAKQAYAGLQSNPTYPAIDGMVFPLTAAFISSGRFSMDDATSTRELYTVTLEFHLPTMDLTWAYTQTDTFIPAFLRILAGDPTLNGAANTMQLGRDNPITFAVNPSSWATTKTLMTSFQIQFKYRGSPSAST